MQYFDRIVDVQMSHYKFGDKRLANRCRFSQLHILLSGSNMSFPQIFKNQYDLKGLYRFANNERVSPEGFSKSYVKGIYELLAKLPASEKPSRFFLFQDSSTASYNDRNVELGYTETGTDNGIMLHHGILTDDKYVPWSLPIQQFIVRDRADYGKSKTRWKRSFENKESYKWVEGFDFGQKFQRKTGIQVVQVMDKEADIADLFNYALKQSNSHFIVNAWHDRKMVGNPIKLLEHLRQLPEEQIVKRTILDKNGKKHLLDCVLKYTSVQLESVDKTLNVVYLKQIEPIAGQELAEWVLLTNLKVKTLQQAEEITEIYAHRWRTCEDFHKCLKTGCSIEKRQIDSPNALFNVISMLSLPAIALLRLRHLAQTDANTPVNTILNDDECQVALMAAKRYLMPIDLTLCEEKSVLWIILLLGRMGGHQGFKQKGMPGWQTIWHGWNYFRTLVDGYMMSKNDNYLQNPPSYG